MNSAEPAATSRSSGSELPVVVSGDGTMLVDSSVWIAHLRGGDDPTAAGILRLIEDEADLATTEPIAMELLAGAGTDLVAESVERLVNGLIQVTVDPHLDFRSAAAIYRAVRRCGRTPRSMVDCLIAAIAIRQDIELVHNDADFDAIADCQPLRGRPLR